MSVTFQIQILFFPSFFVFSFFSFLQVPVYSAYQSLIESIMADIDAHLVEADPTSDYTRVAKDVFAGTCGGIGK